MPESAEQQARDLLERLGHPHAQELTAGDVAELANLIAYRSASHTVLRHQEESLVELSNRVDSLRKMVQACCGVGEKEL